MYLNIFLLFIVYYTRNTTNNVTVLKQHNHIVEFKKHSPPNVYGTNITF